ncbi:hypothetical protein PMAYCL1PPCAC_04224, partial [Pristionchus mayeri]
SRRRVISLYSSDWLSRPLSFSPLASMVSNVHHTAYGLLGNALHRPLSGNDHICLNYNCRARHVKHDDSFC